MTHLLLIIIYIAFISLGLPDALLGSAWPSIYPEFTVPVSYAGIISMTIALGTVISSLQSDRLTIRFGTGKVTAVSVGMTALALFGFSVSHSFPALCLWAIPYGLGAGSVDASLNNYVALHFSGGFALAGFILIGLGCAPVYPCMLHSTPEQFGAERSQAIIGVEMASAYVGTCLMPPLFGAIANLVSIGLLPLHLLVILLLMMVMFGKLNGGQR